MNRDFIEKNKKVFIVGSTIVILFLIVIGSVFITSGRAIKSADSEALPNSEIIPTVDSSVKVELVPNETKNKVTLNVENFPNGTKTLEYELSYETLESTEGASTLPIDVAGTNSLEREIRLGTCSASICRDHVGVKKIKVNLLFTGSYGKKIFEKEFDI